MPGQFFLIFFSSLLNAIFREGVIFIKASSDICEKKNGIRVNSASICSQKFLHQVLDNHETLLLFPQGTSALQY